MTSAISRNGIATPWLGAIETTMIRLYQESDIEDIIDLWYQASLLAHPFLSENFFEQEKHKIQHVYLPNSQTWVYQKKGKPVGFVSLMNNEVGAIFVHPSMHRRGIGKALMDKASSMHDSIEIDVFEANSIGRAFYSGSSGEFVRRF